MVLVFDNDMARAAGARSAACSLHFQVKVLGDVEEVVALRDFEGMRRLFLVDEGNLETAGGLITSRGSG